MSCLMWKIDTLNSPFLSSQIVEERPDDWDVGQEVLLIAATAGALLLAVVVPCPGLPVPPAPAAAAGDSWDAQTPPGPENGCSSIAY